MSVIIYKDRDYKGGNLTLNEGSYPNLSNYNMNDCISSMKVAPGYKCTAYRDYNFTGDSKIYTGDVSYLGDNLNEDNVFCSGISSLIVEKILPTAVALFPTSLALKVSETSQLFANITPTNAINLGKSWMSSNTDVVVVDSNGKVMAIAAGTAAIIVATADGGKMATSAVTVTAATISVTEVSLSETTLELTVGKTKTLEAAIVPTNATNQNKSWISSNPTVAAVDSNGKVIAMAAGTTTIVVSTADGGKMAACALTVVNAIQVEEVRLSETSITLIIDETRQLYAEIVPGNATYQNKSWTSSNAAVASVDDNGKVTAIAEGTAIIEVAAADRQKTAVCTVTAIPPFKNGNGTSSNPYIISTAEELAMLAQLVNAGTDYYNKDYRLGADIDLSDYGEDYNGGNGWIPIGTETKPFDGMFDGNGKTISNLYINDPCLINAGLFGYITTCPIKNVGIVNANITADNNVGGLVGNASGTITNCYVTGRIIAKLNAGGLVGYTFRCVIANCYATAAVYGTTADAKVGGIVSGLYKESQVMNCYSTGEVLSVNSGGGIARYNNAGCKISNCAALNPYVKGPSQNTARVMGFYIDKTLLNNAAFDGMLNQAGNTTWSHKGAKNRDGADIAIADIQKDATLSKRFLEKNGWTTVNGKLPGLFGKTVPMPTHLTISVTGVSLAETELTLKIGETKQLTATLTPTNATNQEKSWISSNTEVATVNANGKVTAIAAGTATIAVVMNSKKRITATCEITVTAEKKEKTVSVTGVSLDETTLTLTAGETKQLTATIDPANATNKTLSWKSSDPAIATVDTSGLVTAIVAGTATITCTAVGEKTANCNITVTATKKSK